MFRLARPRLALQPYHFLAVHDALKALYPNAIVKGFVQSNKAHPFQTDMVCQLEGFERSDVVPQVQKLQSKILAAQLSEVNNLVDVRFHDKEVLTLCFGVPNVDIDLINDTEDWQLRQLYRESLGCSDELFMQLVDDTILRGSDYLQGIFAGKLGIPHVDLPPRAYFVSHVLNQARRHGVANDVNYALYAQVFISTKSIERPTNIIHPFENPFCPGEDWNTLEVVREFLQDVEDESLLETQ